MANRKKQKKKYDYGPGCYERSLNADKGLQITAELLAVEQWKEFSMKNQREDVIRDQILSDINSVCISYICRFSRLSEEFIDELIGLSTGLFNYTNYDLEQVLLISKLCIEEPERREKIIESLLYKYYAPLVNIQRKKLEDQIHEAKINKKKTNKTVTPIIELPKEYEDLDPKLFISASGFEMVIRDKIDWFHIDRYQILSNNFYKKYGHVIKKSMSMVQKESDDYREDEEG